MSKEVTIFLIAMFTQEKSRNHKPAGRQAGGTK